MTKALVVRVQRHKKIGDKSSPIVYTIVRKPKDNGADKQLDEQKKED